MQENDYAETKQNKTCASQTALNCHCLIWQNDPTTENHHKKCFGACIQNFSVIARHTQNLHEHNTSFDTDPRAQLNFLTRLTRKIRKNLICPFFPQNRRELKLLSLLQASPAEWAPANTQWWSQIVWVKKGCSPCSLHPLPTALMMLCYYFWHDSATSLSLTYPYFSPQPTPFHCFGASGSGEEGEKKKNLSLSEAVVGVI